MGPVPRPINPSALHLDHMISHNCKLPKPWGWAMGLEPLHRPALLLAVKPVLVKLDFKPPPLLRVAFDA